MKWFAVEIFLRSLHPDSPGEDWLWEDRIVLFSAENEASARAKAEEYGRKSEVEYVAAVGGRCKWQFVRVGECQELEGASLVEGLEVFSKFLKTDEVESISKPFAE